MLLIRRINWRGRQEGRRSKTKPSKYETNGEKREKGKTRTRTGPDDVFCVISLVDAS